MQVKKGCAPSVEVAADASCRKVKTQRQMEAQESVWSLLTQRHRRCQSDAAAMTRLRRGELHKVGAKAACVDAAAAYVDVAGLHA